MPPKEKKINQISIVAVHGLTWTLLGYVLLFHSPVMNMAHVPTVLWIQQTCRLLLLAIIFYCNSQYAFDKTFRKKNYIGFILWIIAAITIVNILSLKLSDILEIRKVMMENGKPLPPDEKYVDGFMVITTLMVLGISTSMAATKHSQNDERRREDAEHQRMVAELGQLKAQINPHFFFNTLNNIYALSYIDVEESRQTINKLSRMMRYIIYETQPDKVPLKKEIDFLDNYISLMRLRIAENTQLYYNVQMEPSDEVIAPMVLLPFIENAFKHGISSLQQSSILIQIELKNSLLFLKVENDIRTHESATKIEAGGIGLDNTVKRLNLLYQNKFHLETHSENGRYLVNLDINLQ